MHNLLKKDQTLSQTKSATVRKTNFLHVLKRLILDEGCSKYGWMGAKLFFASLAWGVAWGDPAWRPNAYTKTSLHLFPTKIKKYSFWTFAFREVLDF